MSRDSDCVKADVKVIVKLDDGKVTPPFAFSRATFLSRRELDEVFDYTGMQREAEKTGKPVPITTWETIRNVANAIAQMCKFTKEDLCSDHSAKSSRPTRARSSTAS